MLRLTRNLDALHLPSTVQPTDWAVPRISFMTPPMVFDIDLRLFSNYSSVPIIYTFTTYLGLIIRAALMMSSMVMLPLCLMFLTFLRSRGGSLSALIIKAAADGTTSTVAWRFWMVNLTVTFKPFQSFKKIKISLLDGLIKLGAWKD